MERCKYCGEVLEFNAQTCPACKKSTSKEPSKRFLKKKAKRDAFVVNYDAKLVRTSYKVFGIIFLILSLILFVFYGQYFFYSIGKVSIGDKFVNTIDKVFKLNTTVNKYLPMEITALGDSKVTFSLAFYSIALILSIFSLFTKRVSISSTMYKIATIIGLIFLVFVELISSFLYDSLYNSVMKNIDIISYVVAGITIVLFVIGFIASFNLKNPYRATWYQGFKALYFCAMVWLFTIIVFLSSVVKLDNVKVYEILLKVMTYIAVNAPIYLFVSSILLFIGRKYRGDLDRLI